jgi:hypothetical protein
MEEHGVSLAAQTKGAPRNSASLEHFPIADGVEAFLTRHQTGHDTSSRVAGSPSVQPTPPAIRAHLPFVSALERQTDDETTRPDKPSLRIVPAQGRELHLHFLHILLEAHPQQPGLAFREQTLLTKPFRPRARPAAKADRPLTACHHLLDLRSRKTQAAQRFDRLRADGTKRDLQARHRFHPGTLDRNRRRVGLAYGLEAGNGKPCGSIRSRLQVEPLGDELQNDMAKTPLEHPKRVGFRFAVGDEVRTALLLPRRLLP